MSVGLVTIKVGSERTRLHSTAQLRNRCITVKYVTLTFDLDADLVLVPPCDVADNTQVGSLVPNLNVLYLQSPVAVGLKTVAFKIPLPILRPAEKKPSCSFFQAVKYLPNMFSPSQLRHRRTEKSAV